MGKLQRDQRDFDAVVIGSGAGGLTAAVCLARAGKKVAVFEQHYLPGGWCHSFALGGYKFSPGVHYIGGLGPGGYMRRIYEGIGVANDLTFLELNPDGYDHVRVGDETFDIPKGKERFADRLKQRFPSEAAGIDGYLDTCERISDQLSGAIAIKGLGDAVKAAWSMRDVLRYGGLSLDRHLDKFTKDPLLRAILTIQAGDHGVGPKRALTAVHAAVQAHYFDGGWYPKGGAKALPKAFLRELRRHDGEIHVRTGVDRILVEGGGATGATRRATGVRLKDGSEVRAPIVVCNADPNVTYTRLVAPEHVDPAIRRRLKRTKWSISALSLFLAVDKDVRAAGLDSGNYWWAKTTDIQAGYDLAHAPNLSDIKEFPTSFLTCTTLKDPSKRAEDAPHTMEAFCFVSHAAFKRWHDSKYDDRPGEYERVKEQLTDKMFDALEHTLPGIRDAAVFTELGTPLTNRHYVEATDGNLYGTEKTWREVGPFAWPVKTKISGLLMCGASTISHGVAGATMSGMVAARIALGCRHRDLYQPAGQELVCVPADSVRPSAKAGEHLAA